MTDTIYELRDYTLRPGKRDVLIDLFERRFIEPQEALGAHVRATLRDLDQPDRFVWIRSCADAHARFAALDGFYSSDVWRAHRNAANATILDSDNVLQLRPAGGAIPAARSIESTQLDSETLIVCTTYFPKSAHEFAEHFAGANIEHLREISAAPFALFTTDPAPNVYPRLPIRDESVFVTLTRFASVTAHDEKADAIADVGSVLAPLCVAPAQIRRLQPTRRSALR